MSSGTSPGEAPGCPNSETLNPILPTPLFAAEPPPSTEGDGLPPSTGQEVLNPPRTREGGEGLGGEGLSADGYAMEDAEGDVKDEHGVVCSKKLAAETSVGAPSFPEMIDLNDGAGGRVSDTGGKESVAQPQDEDMGEVRAEDGLEARQELHNTEGGKEAVGNGVAYRDNGSNVDSAKGGDKGPYIESQATVNLVVDLSASHGAVEGSASTMVEDEAFAEKDSMEAESKEIFHEKDNFPRYLLGPEDCKFAVSDMVWGKVRSHPWWPAQIFDPSDASEAALKYKKRDSYLVAYFGDHTFAWNDVSLLRPYRTHFTQMAKQSSMAAFVNAVNCSLDEVSRRVEFGLACYCTPNDVYDKIKSQHIDNVGIREGASVAYGAYGSFNMTSFEPDKLVCYLKDLALCPSGGCDKLDLTMAKAQLLSFYRTKGYSELPNFSIHLAWPDKEAELLHPGSTVIDVNVMEIETPVSKKVKSQDASSEKRKSSFSEDGFGRSKKQRSLADLMDCKSSESVKSSKNRISVDSASVGSALTRKRKFVSLNDADKADNSPVNKKLFKVGERISRIATKLARSPLTCKSSNEKVKRNARVDENNHEGVTSDLSPRAHEVRRRKAGNAVDYSSLDELLSQLCLAARDPLKLYSFIPTVTGFFSDYRSEFCRDNSDLTKGIKKISACKSRGRKPVKSESVSNETVKSEGVKDSHWADPTVHGGEEEAEKKSESDHPLKKDDHNLSCAKDGEVSPEEVVEEYSPTALILSFTEVDSLPSQTDLVKIFGQYGPLEESETEVMRKTKRAKVVFKKKANAEVAFSSAGKFHIFGPALVSYRLRDLPSPPKFTHGCALMDKKRESPVRSGDPVAMLTDDVNSQVDCGAQLLATHEKKLMSQMTENVGTKDEGESEHPSNDGSSQM